MKDQGEVGQGSSWLSSEEEKEVRGGGGKRRRRERRLGGLKLFALSLHFSLT